MRRFVEGDVLIMLVSFPPYLRRLTEAVWYHRHMMILVDRSLSEREREEAVIRLVGRQLDAPAAVAVPARPAGDRG